MFLPPFLILPCPVQICLNKRLFELIGACWIVDDGGPGLGYRITRLRLVPLHNSGHCLTTPVTYRGQPERCVPDLERTDDPPAYDHTPTTVNVVRTERGYRIRCLKDGHYSPK